MTTLDPAGDANLALANADFVTAQLIVGGDLDVFADDLAVRQLEELVGAGLTHVIDARIEANDEELVTALAPEVSYLWHGMDDAGQRVPAQWFSKAVDWAMTALENPDAVLLAHCHMGVNRGPSLGFAVLLAQGWDPVDAIARIRHRRPVANVWYAADALRWHHDITQADAAVRRRDHARLDAWREEHPLDVVRVIAQRRRDEQP